MTTTTPQPPRSTANWREAALAKSEIISDAWEVTKTYAGRLAEWILFCCMVANIIEIMTSIPVAVSNIILGTQVVMLDVGGFSLATMGEYAREQGDTRAARKASITGYFLIAVTIVTLLLVTIGLLWTQTHSVITGAEKGLILVRIVMTVIYAHVIHSLRRATAQRQQATFTDQLTDLTERVTDSEQRVTDLLQRLTDLSVRLAASDISDRLTEIDRRLTDQTDRLTDRVASLHTALQEQTGTIAGLAALPAHLSELERSLSSLTTVTPTKPRLSVVAQERIPRSVSVPATLSSERPTDRMTDTDKGAFVRRCLTDHPTMRVADIQRQAASQGLTIAHSYISDIRKTFRAEQDKHTQQETA